MVARQLGAATRFPRWLSYKAYGHGRAMLAPTGVFRHAKPSPLGEGGPAGPDEGGFAAIARSRVAVAHLPLIRQRAGPLTASPEEEPFSRTKKQTPLLCSVCYAVAYCPAGSVNTNRHQLPSSLSAWIWPPERLTKILQICSPSPLPRVFMPRERSSL